MEGADDRVQHPRDYLEIAHKKAVWDGYGVFIYARQKDKEMQAARDGNHGRFYTLVTDEVTVDNKLLLEAPHPSRNSSTTYRTLDHEGHLSDTIALYSVLSLKSMPDDFFKWFQDAHRVAISSGVPEAPYSFVMAPIYSSPDGPSSGFYNPAQASSGPSYDNPSSVAPSSQGVGGPDQSYAPLQQDAYSGLTGGEGPSGFSRPPQEDVTPQQNTDGRASRRSKWERLTDIDGYRNIETDEVFRHDGQRTQVSDKPVYSWVMEDGSLNHYRNYTFSVERGTVRESGRHRDKIDWSAVDGPGVAVASLSPDLSGAHRGQKRVERPRYGNGGLGGRSSQQPPQKIRNRGRSRSPG
jgi:hypothetical protein